MNNYWTTTSTGLSGSWTTSTSHGKYLVNYIIKNKK